MRWRRALADAARVAWSVTRNIQWLLIGGPHDGETLWIKQGSRVAYDGTVYQGQNYLHGGRLYRVGFVDPNDLEPSKVARLIRETELAHIAGS